MGGTRSSSKRKSSKRKSSKLSSEGRRKKRSRRTTSRKLRRRDDSSSYSGDDSSSSESILSSSSEDDYRRARSRAKTEVKGSRKRTQRSSSSRESSEDSRHAKKRKGSQRKGSKRSAKSETGKKSQKKRRRREPSVSSISGDSRSCSTCRGGSAGSGEREFKTSRGRSRENSKDKGDLGKAKTGTKSNKNRSRSASPCSKYSDSGGYNSKDMVPVENSSRRLRSVITVAKSPEDEKKEWEKDVHKEEIAYDHDDYPSCRSNDSNDGGSKREIAHHPFDLERKSLENAKGEESLVSDTRMTKITQSSDEGGVEDSHCNSHSDGAGASSCRENKTQVFPTSSSANGDDLESILRLKALENLKKYQGGIQTKAKPPADEKTKIDSEVKMLSTAKAEFVRNNSNKEDDSRVLGANKVLDQNPRPTIRRDSSFPAASYVKVREGKGSVTESGRARRSVVRQPSLEAISGNPKEEDPSPAGAVTSKSELGKSARREESSDTILNQTQKENMLVTESDVDKSSAETSKSVGQTGGNNGRVDNVAESATSEPSSSLKPTLEEQTLKDQQGGQFEQKTMSVMRGGEMVEVSYKVYIPKKAPALARRQLRR